MSRPLLRLSKSCLGEAERRAVLDVLADEYLGMGAWVQRFESALEDFFGRPVACVATGTAALHLALQAAQIGPGDEVLVPSLTYVASFQAIAASGATPVACDIDERTLCLDPRDAEGRVTERTRAVMPVHYAGAPADMTAIQRMARRHGLRVVEDAAHAFGSRYDGKRIGSFGDIACFSFDGIKNITSGEGGCVVADDDVLLERVRDARLLGVRRDTQSRYQGRRSWDFDVTAQGWRYHMSNLMAAIGLAQLGRFEELARRRRALARHYIERLRDVAGVSPVMADIGEIVPHIFVVRIAGLEDRDRLRAVLLEEGIETGVHYKPNHHLTLFRDSARAPLPVTERVYRELLSLPLHPDMTLADVDHVCDGLLAGIGAR